MASDYLQQDSCGENAACWIGLDNEFFDDTEFGMYSTLMRKESGIKFLVAPLVGAINVKSDMNLIYQVSLILLGWEGIETEDGKEFAYDFFNLGTLMVNYPRLILSLASIAATLAYDQQEGRRLHG